MYISIKDHDYDIQKIISNGDIIPGLKKRDKVEPKSRLEYAKVEAERVTKNYKALNSLFQG